jgi:hypothetical protein
MSLAYRYLRCSEPGERFRTGSHRVVVRRARPPLEPDAALAAPRQVAARIATITPVINVVI